MPNIRSAEKRMRQGAKQRQRNRANKSRVRTFTKKVTTAIEAKDLDEAEARMRDLQKVVDKAAKGKTIHRNKAARRKSRIQKQLNAAKAAKSEG